ncbi:hypothetical protein [Acinetobacter tjernbergiae]|uniref:Uncharacterized protein n=1 Tax=Acinetobacter tjernbergiae DSM 14971 = CIP 107465 TaxID=1120928 RepID=V2W401_9GAMM|nr:hypothetical protein [Acinetobacter tjernbergiae]ESK54719.1 hypothetical protein F990_02461 [Acinetobacter tjernbergiae DSM 14971 = CIP 107465]
MSTSSSLPKNIVIIFSGENLETIRQQGGTGDWILNTNNFINVEYVLIIRNLKNELADKSDGYEHGQAFILGKFQAIKPKATSDRKIIQISEFIQLPHQESFKNAWTKLTSGQRNPITYKNSSEVLEKIKLNLDNPEFKWQKMQPAEEEINLSLADIINEARNKIAKAANVDKSKVNIQISF